MKYIIKYLLTYLKYTKDAEITDYRISPFKLGLLVFFVILIVIPTITYLYIHSSFFRDYIITSLVVSLFITTLVVLVVLGINGPKRY